MGSTDAGQKLKLVGSSKTNLKNDEPLKFVSVTICEVL